MRISWRGKSPSKLGLALSLCAVLLATSPTAAQAPERRIRFGAGRSSAVVKGRLVNRPGVDEAWQNYVLKVGEGQTVTVRLTSQGDRAGFRLTYPNGQLAEDPDGNAGHKEWSGESPAAGDCRIEVSHGSDARVTPYTLEVSVR
jgi:hypothetical protein